MAGFFATAYNRKTKNIHFGDQYRVHVKNVSTGALVTIYEDAAQTITKTNPFNPTRDGDIVFFAPAGTYNIELYNRDLLIDSYDIVGVDSVAGEISLEGGVVINDLGASVDFRVEGDTDVNMIFGDGSTDRVGIGTATPGEKLHVSSSGAVGMRVESTGDADSSVVIKNTNGEWQFVNNDIDGRLTVKTATDTIISVGLGSTEVLTVSRPFQVSVSGAAVALSISDSTANIALLADAGPNFQSMDRGIFIGNADSVPAGNPSAGGFLYVEAGALKYRGSSGTVTTLGVA